MVYFQWINISIENLSTLLSRALAYFQWFPITTVSWSFLGS